jgi:hypothetical protein
VRYVRRLLRLRVRLYTRNSLSVCPRCARLAVSERFVFLCPSRPRFYGQLSPSAIQSCLLIVLCFTEAHSPDAAHFSSFFNFDLFAYRTLPLHFSPLVLCPIFF